MIQTRASRALHTLTDAPPAQPWITCAMIHCRSLATHTVYWSDGDTSHECFGCAWESYHERPDQRGVRATSMTTGIVNPDVLVGVAR